MRRPCSIVCGCVVAIMGLALPALAGVSVSRRSLENPAVEIFRSTVHGALAGTVVGVAFAVVDDGGNDGEIIENDFASGTFVGLGLGVYFVATRPQPAALLQIEGGDMHLACAAPCPTPRPNRSRSRSCWRAGDPRRSSCSTSPAVECSRARSARSDQEATCSICARAHGWRLGCT